MPSDRCRWPFRCSTPTAKWSTKPFVNTQSSAGVHTGCRAGLRARALHIEPPTCWRRGRRQYSRTGVRRYTCLITWPTKIRCLILACGNTLRSDDGVGPWLAAWAEERFAAEPAVRIIARQQWTPDLAEDIAGAESVIFIDCAVDMEPGSIRIAPVEPSPAEAGLATHHSGAAELLALSEELFAARPRNALLLTIGAGSTEMGETFSKSVNVALPEACDLLEHTVRNLLVPG